MELTLITWLVCGITTAIIAGSKGRNAFAWLFIGFLGGLFALIAVCAMPAIGKGQS